jgi:hypothetical protein
MRKFLVPAVIVIVFLSACGEPGIDYDTTIPPVQPKNLPLLTGTDSATATTTINGATQPNAANNNVAFNPEHGQPNHRCDIAVGAPLNSSPYEGKQTPPTTPINSNPLINTSGSVKLNPEHGMPGHDCAIAVGEPLRS